MSEPKGGTELQLAFLESRVDSDLLNHFQICTSIPNKVPIDENKITSCGKKTATTNPTFDLFFKTSLIIINTIGMCLTRIGTMRSFV